MKRKNGEHNTKHMHVRIHFHRKGEMMNPPKAYKNMDFMNSPEARSVRILCEYEEPMRRFQVHNVTDTVVFFGSARAKSRSEFLRVRAELEQKIAQGESLEDELIRHNKTEILSDYYEKTRELARRMTEWDMSRGWGTKLSGFNRWRPRNHGSGKPRCF